MPHFDPLTLDGRLTELQYVNAELNKEIERLRAEVQHWKSNHDNRVEAVRVLIERNDLPLDRVPAYKHYLHLQEDVAALRAENESLRKVFDAAENLVKVKGRFHSEQAYGRLVTAVAGMKVEE